MRFVLNAQEAKLITLLAEADLVDLAVELDYVPEEQIDRMALLGELVPRIVELAGREGLPFSKYDADDLEELPQEHRTALAKVMGWDAKISTMLRKGARVYKTYKKRGASNPIPRFLPLLLTAVARCAHQARSGRLPPQSKVNANIRT